jgi:hypothetical protein
MAISKLISIVEILKRNYEKDKISQKNNIFNKIDENNKKVAHMEIQIALI